MDLSDCSRLLYHWAISPPLLTPLFDSTCLKYRSGKASEKEMRKQMGKQYWCGQRPLAAVFGIISMGCNIVQFWHQRRRWYNGQHSCLPSSWSGFDSRPTQFFFFFFVGEEDKLWNVRQFQRSKNWPLKTAGRDSSVGRALDWRSKGPRFDPGSRHFCPHLFLAYNPVLEQRYCWNDLGS